MPINSRGFTLVELIGSISVFVIGLAALLGICLQSLTMTKRSEEAYTAYNIAKNRIENLRALDFGELSSAEETATAVDKKGDADAGGAYTRTTEITTSYSGDSSLTQATVTVDYSVKGSQSLSPMEMTTVIYDA